MTVRPRGVYCAALTPLDEDLAPDHRRFHAHCKRLLAEGCDGVSVLGTTGEANSFSVAERKALLERLVKDGIAPEGLLPGTGVSAIPETVELTRHALSLGITNVLMLPPFYYKAVSDAGLATAYARIIEAVADPRLGVVLYHIPPISQIPLSFGLIETLLARFPDTIVGVKDSSGDFDHMAELCHRFPGLSIFAGADPLMLPLLPRGGAGCITAASNIVAPDLRYIFDHHAEPRHALAVEAAQERVVAARALAGRFGQIPTLKALIAARDGEPGWRRVRPPLMPLDAVQAASLAS